MRQAAEVGEFHIERYGQELSGSLRPRRGALAKLPASRKTRTVHRAPRVLWHISARHMAGLHGGRTTRPAVGMRRTWLIEATGHLSTHHEKHGNGWRHHRASTELAAVAGRRLRSMSVRDLERTLSRDGRPRDSDPYLPQSSFPVVTPANSPLSGRLANAPHLPTAVSGKIRGDWKGKGWDRVGGRGLSLSPTSPYRRSRRCLPRRQGRGNKLRLHKRSLFRP